MNVGLLLTLALVLLLSYLEYHRRVEGQTRLWMILAGVVLPVILLLFVLFMVLRLNRFA